MSANKIRANTMRGMSLVELLIAMTLGLFLTAGMLTVFSGNKRSSELNSAMADMQETARFVLNALSNDIRMAGYQGCLNPMQSMMKVRSIDSPVPLIGTDSSGEPIHDFNASAATGAVVTQANTWTAGLNGGFVAPDDNAAIPGTHVLSVQFGSRRNSMLTGPIMAGGVPSPNGDIPLVDNLGLETGDLAIISNCDNADLFTVTGVNNAGAGQTLQHGPTLNNSGSLDGFYGRPQNIAMTRVMRFISNIYYIGDTELENDSGQPIRALYQQSYPYDDDDNPPTEIAQGIENMRLAFGIRDADGLRYLQADDPDFNPNLVESVQIGLMMTSWDDISEQEDNNTYLIAGQTIDAGNDPDDGNTHNTDKRFRLVFNTTVKIRNRTSADIIDSQLNAAL